MVVDPEAVHAALFARLSSISTLTSASFKTRRAVTWDEVGADRQPALLVLASDEDPNRQLGQTTIWTFRPEVVFYVREPNDRALSVETTIHQILKQVDDALRKQSTEVQPDDDPSTTLGLPYVFRCYRGRTRVHHGLDVDQAAVSMLIEIVAVETT